eukprot:CAMPEP_0119302420 /NCGR_PEP_ID=MMETSP1333-20130426/4015_1 /TAXON_ID=418940 /ORGANISM="Scyphosphaera apsteinii, Strain RCC1455" /LENGTH=265 /DNA_ID=CAMNT_0007304763 /DNA_START=249 /DNA_END=1047 /DNA_ORIENTATION=-
MKIRSRAPLLAMLLAITLLAFDLDRISSLVWIAYLTIRPSASLWDWIYGRQQAGGLWNYGPRVHNELVCYVNAHYPDYSSLLDVSSNLGYMISRLQHEHPNASHRGSDISHRMVEATGKRCKSCATQQFDLHRLLDVDFTPGQAGVPPVADIVICSDVLYFIGWGGWPPALLQLRLVPFSWLRPSQQLFFTRLRSLAVIEVVFSSHQLNRAVLDAFQANGMVAAMACLVQPALPEPSAHCGGLHGHGGIVTFAIGQAPSSASGGA